MGIERYLPASVKSLALVVALGIGVGGCERSLPSLREQPKQAGEELPSIKPYWEEAPDIYRQERRKIIALYADTDNDHYLSQDEIDDLLIDVAGKCDLLYVADTDISTPGTNISTQEGFLVATGRLVDFEGLGISFASGDPGEEPSYVHLANCFTSYGKMKEWLQAKNEPTQQNSEEYRGGPEQPH